MAKAERGLKTIIEFLIDNRQIDKSTIDNRQSTIKRASATAEALLLLPD